MAPAGWSRPGRESSRGGTRISGRRRLAAIPIRSPRSLQHDRNFRCPNARRSAARRHRQVDIISIQSQVVYGCVGNNAAMPVFRKAGWRALAVPTVILSNTPHYPTLHGGAVPWIGSTACCRVWKTGA